MGPGLLCDSCRNRSEVLDANSRRQDRLSKGTSNTYVFFWGGGGSTNAFAAAEQEQTDEQLMDKVVSDFWCVKMSTELEWFYFLGGLRDQDSNGKTF